MVKLIVFALIVLIPVIYFAKTKRTAYLAATIMAAGLSLLMVYSLYITKPPHHQTLKQVQGVIERVDNRNNHTKDIVFRSESSPLSFSYLDWYPDFDDVSDYLKSKSHLTISYDPNSDLNEGIIPWNIESNNIQVVSFEILKSTRNKNRWFAIAIFFASAFCSIYLYRKTPAA